MSTYKKESILSLNTPCHLDDLSPLSSDYSLFGQDVQTQILSYQERLNALYRKYTELFAHAKALKNYYHIREEKFKIQISLSNQTQKSFIDRISCLIEKNAQLKKIKNKTVLKFEALQKKIEVYKNQEDFYQNKIKEFEKAEKEGINKIQKNKTEIESLLEKLAQSEKVCKKVSIENETAQKTMNQSLKDRKKLEDMIHSLGQEKKENQHFKEQMKQEKQEKLNALARVHQLEARLSQASQELVKLQKVVSQKFEESGITLDF